MSLKPQKIRPSFFKVLINDFTRILRLPPNFIQKYGSNLRESVKLRVRTGEIWKVKMEKMEDGKYYCFNKGWNKFAKDVGLEFGEFIVFWFVTKSTFDVSIYGINACERDIINPPISFHDDDDQTEPDEVEYKSNHNAQDVINYKPSKSPNGGASKPNHNLYFEIVLKNHHKYRVTLRRNFLVAAGLMGKQTVGLEYKPNHRYQAVVLDHIRYRTDMASGWARFRKINGLVLGKTYSFEFKPRKNVIEIQEVKKIV